MSLNCKPVTLCILDGWGLSDTHQHNAVALAKTPNFDRLWSGGAYATTQLSASGQSVGLPEGQIGNSEVGHLNLGAGRKVQQTLPRMDQAFEGNSIPTNDAYIKFAAKARAGSGRVHLVGLASNGGVHAHSRHLIGLAKLLQQDGFTVLFHLWSDGRDVAPNACVEQWPDLFQSIDARDVASVCGRYFAMDRDQRWQRVAQAYDAMVNARAAESFDDPLAYVQRQSGMGVGDEFIPAATAHWYQGFAQGDALVCANFRADRVREILDALLEPQFDGFARGAAPTLSAALAMTPYSDTLAQRMDVLFVPETLPMGLGETIERAGLAQFRMAETEKYPHVTFFFSGGREAPYDGEDRFLAQSPMVATYDLQPQMSCGAIGEALAKVITAQAHNVIICNFANPDMVGHTGDLNAAIAACEAVDAQLGAAIAATLNAGGAMLVTADHGNCEQMWDPDGDGPHTAHTTNPVPLILVGGPDGAALDQAPAALCDIAPTILALAGIAQPPEMTGRSLLIV